MLMEIALILKLLELLSKVGKATRIAYEKRGKIWIDSKTMSLTF